MTNPKELKYTKSHEWVKFIDDTSAIIGLTDFAQNALGDLVYVELPEVDDELKAGESFAEVESVKAVSDVFSPVDAVISKVNDELADAPESINSNPYEAWIVEVKDISATEDFLSSQEYEEFCLSEGE